MYSIETVKNLFLNWAEIVDAWRVAPRAVLWFYGAMVFKVTFWFMSLENPSAEQAGVIMAIWGAAALIFNFYAKSGRAWGPQVEWGDGVGTNEYLARQKQNYYGQGRYNSHGSGMYGNSRRNRRRQINRNPPIDSDQEEEDA